MAVEGEFIVYDGAVSGLLIVSWTHGISALAARMVVIWNTTAVAAKPTGHNSQAIYETDSVQNQHSCFIQKTNACTYRVLHLPSLVRALLFSLLSL